MVQDKKSGDHQGEFILRRSECMNHISWQSIRQFDEIFQSGPTDWHCHPWILLKTWQKKKTQKNTRIMKSLNSYGSRATEENSSADRDHVIQSKAPEQARKRTLNEDCFNTNFYLIVIYLTVRSILSITCQFYYGGKTNQKVKGNTRWREMMTTCTTSHEPDSVWSHLGYIRGLKWQKMYIFCKNLANSVWNLSSLFTFLPLSISHNVLNLFWISVFLFCIPE